MKINIKIPPNEHPVGENLRSIGAARNRAKKKSRRKRINFQRLATTSTSRTASRGADEKRCNRNETGFERGRGEWETSGRWQRAWGRVLVEKRRISKDTRRTRGRAGLGSPVNGYGSAEYVRRRHRRTCEGGPEWLDVPTADPS